MNRLDKINFLIKQAWAEGNVAAVVKLEDERDELMEQQRLEENARLLAAFSSK